MATVFPTIESARAFRDRQNAKSHGDQFHIEQFDDGYIVVRKREWV